jgi:4-hydroxythreonine-4-phosphate dehydrogenase
MLRPNRYRQRRAVRLLSLPLTVEVIDTPEELQLIPNTIHVISLSRLPEDLPFGQLDARSGRAAFDYIWTTIHVSLREAIEQVTIERELMTIRLAHQAMIQLGMARPRIAVAGLNPHGGEHGLFGSEDETIIKPAIQQAQAEGIEVSGPWPGDTVFMNARQGQFDIVVAQYHDQGLIPVKYLGVDEGVNITVGLPFVRTSVDHGTAFDIAGTGKASPASLRVALQQAAMLARQSNVDADDK